MQAGRMVKGKRVMHTRPNGHGAQLRAAREPRGYIRRAAGESTARPAARRLEDPAGRAAAARQLQRLVGRPAGGYGAPNGSILNVPASGMTVW
jgi:hypothetical protein